MALKEFAPPAAPLRVSDPQPAQNYVILEVGAEWGGTVPHPSPARMMAFSLSGCTRVTASSGESHTFVAGDCLLHHDTLARGIALKSYRTCLLDGYLSASQIRFHLRRRDVSLGSIASVRVCWPYVRSYPDSDRNSDLLERRLSATRRHPRHFRREPTSSCSNSSTRPRSIIFQNLRDFYSAAFIRGPDARAHDRE
jgi:hypothetical protein